MKKQIIRIIITVAGSLLTAQIQAATYTWDVNAADGATITDGSGDWSTNTSNWNNAGANVVWADGNVVSFGGGTLGSAGTVTLGGNVTAGQITFNAAHSGYVLDTGTNTLTTFGGYGAVFVNGSTFTTINSDANGGLILPGAGSIFVTTGILTNNAKISGTGALSQFGAGSIYYNNNGSDFTGKFYTQNGGGSYVTSIANSGVASAVGSGSMIELAYGGRLYYTGGATSTDRTLALSGGSGGGSIFNNGSGALVFTGSFANSMTAANTLVLGGANSGANEIRNNLSNSTDPGGYALAVTKQDAGTWKLSGTNPYTGATTVSGGTLALSSNGVLATNSAITINGGTLDMGSQNATNNLGNNNGITFGASGGNLNGSGTLTIVGLNASATAFTVAANSNAVVNENIIATNSSANTYQALASVGSGATLTINGQVNSYYSGNGIWLQGGGKLVLNNPSGNFSLISLWQTGGTISTPCFSALGVSGYMVMGQNAANGPATFIYTGPATNTSFYYFAATLTPSIFNNGSGAVTFSAANFTSPYGAPSSTTPQTLTLGGLSDISILGNIRDANPAGGYNTGLVKTNGNTLTLAGNSTYHGGTTIKAGILQLGDGATSNGSVTGNITNNATLVFNNPNPQVFSDVISGSGTVIKRVTGVLTLTGNNTYSGPTIIHSGTLAMSGSGSIGNSLLVSVTNGATLDVSGLSSGFTLGASQTLSNNAASTGILNGNFNTSSGTVSVSYVSAKPSFLIANGTFNLNGFTTFTINNTGVALTNGSYKIIAKGTGGLVSGAVPSVTVVGSGVVGGVGSSLQITNGELYLAVGVTSSIINLVWTGADTGNPTRWNNLQTDTNWFTAQSVPDQTHYYDDNQILFDDSNNGHYTVNVTTSVSPGWLAVNNSAGNYVFSGSGGAINGTTGLTKDGTGTLTLNLANGFTGNTTVNGGSVMVGDGAALAGSSVTVNAGGGLTFAVNAATLGNLAGSGSVSLNNGGSPVSLTVGGNHSSATYAGNLSGPGNLIKTGAGSFTLTGSSVIGGTATISNGMLAVNGSLSSSALAVRGSILSGRGTINGPVSVETDGTLWPGGAGDGQLTINNSLNLGTVSSTVIRVGRNFTNFNNTISGISQLTYGGTLMITNPGNIIFAAGDSFKLFDAAQYLGAFNSSNLPALGTGLKWDLVGLTNNGTIRVVPFWSVPAVFADNMVLQRGMSVPVWGTAEPGQTVTVTFEGQTKYATTGSDRTWRVQLDSMTANTNSQQLTITITGVTNLTYTNVVVGDVWLASGQSNMYFPVNGNNPNQSVINAVAETAVANYPLIRHMRVRQTGALTPAWDTTLDWSWTPCSPASVPNLSAVAYFFARTLFQSNNVQGTIVPIGILESAYGGTPLEAWTSAAAMDAVPELKTFADQNLANYYNGTQTSITFVRGAMYNAMISPLIPFAIRGVIWYQGESGGGASTMQYRVLFPTMIQDWRLRWQQADFPFYFVQLPSLTIATGWPYTREAQTLTLQTATNTGMAVIFDVDDPSAIHPGNKQDVGSRLANLALNRNYGFTNIMPSGPLFRTYAIETNQIRIYFDYAENGLMTGQKNNLDPVQELVGVAPQWFEIAGANQSYVPANAQIDTNGTVVVSSPSVPNPTLVRYAWSAVPMGTNLYNRAGLPASPFRIPVWTNAHPPVSLQLNGGGIQTTCTVPNNVTWWVEYNDSLSASAWVPLILPQTGTGAVQTVADPINGRAQRFYRWGFMP